MDGPNSISWIPMDDNASHGLSPVQAVTDVSGLREGLLRLWKENNALNELTALFESGFAERLTGGRRRIGLEPEFVVVDSSSGLSASVEQTVSALAAIARRLGLEPIDDGMAFQGSLAMRSGIDNGSIRIGTDMGSGLWEIAFPPALSITHAMNMLSFVMKESIAVADAKGLSILGLGVQPISMPSMDIVMPKKRYKELMARHNTHNVMEAPDVDSIVNTLPAANHVHLEVTAGEAIGAVNMFNLIAPELIALTANSGILNGRTFEQASSVSELFWDLLVKGSKDMGRTGIPGELPRSMSEYVGLVCGFEPVLTKRNGEFVFFTDNKSMIAFKVDDGIAVVAGSDEKIGISFEPVDMFINDSFAWFDARLKGELGTVEIRSFAQQPTLNESLATAALALGLMENPDQVMGTIGSRSASEASELREQVIKDGLKAVHGNVSVRDSAIALIGAAATGLMRRGEDPNLLQCLALRAFRGENPSDVNRTIVAGSPESLIRSRKLRA